MSTWKRVDGIKGVGGWDGVSWIGEVCKIEDHTRVGKIDGVYRFECGCRIGEVF